MRLKHVRCAVQVGSSPFAALDGFLGIAGVNPKTNKRFAIPTRAIERAKFLLEFVCLAAGNASAPSNDAGHKTVCPASIMCIRPNMPDRVMGLPQDSMQ